jgi:glyoxylase-like metal-dependent hydrolase (beta-lactamase superfamily II)
VRLALALSLVALFCGLAPAGQPQQPAAPPSASPGIEIQKVAEGVYAAVRTEPPGLMFNANSVFIVNDEDVVVVDTTITPSSAREAIAALRKLTPKPVRYVINTHFHDDHVMGNQVYREEFPGVEFIAHATTREDMTTVGVANRKQLIEGAPPIVAQIRTLMSQNKSLAGGALTEEERASYASDIAQVERYLAEASNFEIVLPAVTLEERLTLHRGGRTIEVRHLGRGHSRGDVVVYLPKENILISGDLVVWPVPLVGTTSFPGDFGASLEKLLALEPAVIIPGHGPVMRDDSYVRLVARLLHSIKQQTETAVARGETLEQARKSVDLGEFRKAIAGDSQLKGFIFDFYVTSPAVAAAFRQAREKS